MNDSPDKPAMPRVTVADSPLPGRIPQPDYAPGEREALMDERCALLAEKDAVLVAHYYTDDDLQLLADKTGGTVSDSLEMARLANWPQPVELQ